MDYFIKSNIMGNTLLKGCKILIVEDDVSSKLYLNKILEKTGAILLNAGDGGEAVEIVRNNPDTELILMDIQLPVMDGYLATEKIREFRNDIIIIAQTAYGLLGDMEKISAAGFNDFIIKPILSKVLIEKMLVNQSIWRIENNRRIESILTYSEYTCISENSSLNTSVSVAHLSISDLISFLSTSVSRIPESPARISNGISLYSYS